MKNLFALLFLFTCATAFGTANQKLVIQNQFGETSINTLTGSYVPLPGTANQVIITGASAPTSGGSGTGHGIAGTGSMYLAQDSGLLYLNTNTKASPTWTIQTGNGITAVLTGFSAGAGTVAATDTVLQGFNKLAGNTQNLTVLANVLTAFSAGAGTVTSADTILQAAQKFQGNDAQLKNGTFTPAPETIAAAGAISTTLMETILANGTGGDYAATLAAPSSQDGQLKILKMTTATHAVTLAMTNIAMSGGYTPTGTTTMTFSITGQSAVFMAVGAKWVYLGGSAVVT